MPETLVNVFTLAGQLEVTKEAYAVRDLELTHLVQQAQLSETDANRERHQFQVRMRRLRQAIEAQQLDLFTGSPVEALKGLR